MESSRRQQAQENLGINTEKQFAQHENALAKEQARQAKKEAKRQKMMNKSSYKILRTIAKSMDKYFLDPIIGFFFPGTGDILSSALALPYIYYSLFVVKSMPLTLAVINNTMVDVLIGAIPLIGDFLDIFKRSYIDNLKLITGYIEDDKEIIDEVRRKAIWSAVSIIIICVLIYLAVYLTKSLVNWVSSFF